MSYEPVAGGQLAAVVTFLEMRERRELDIPTSGLHLQRINSPQADAYRELFRLVGSKWLWFSRLIMDDNTLAPIIEDPRVELHAIVAEQGTNVGMLELDFRLAGECELAFVGLTPELSGKGHGRWLLGEAVRLAWRSGVNRVHVHTCSLDHPAALSAYRSAGFTPFKRAIERFPDPRLLGILPIDCAPQIPIIKL